MSLSKPRVGAFFRKKKAFDIDFSDLSNVANFITVYSLDEEDFIFWCQLNGLLCAEIFCEVCQKNMTIVRTKTEQLGYSFRCKRNRHSKSLKAYSFFFKSHIAVQDCLYFLKYYLSKMPAKMILEDLGLSKVVGADLSNFIREVMAEEVITVLNSGHQLKGLIQIDESKFGHLRKYGKGSRFGDGIWVFGLIEVDTTGRQTDNFLVFPVQYRNKETLIAIIMKYVAPDSTILSDAFSSYQDLNDCGKNYKHFSVCHSEEFTHTYVNQVNGEHFVVHTNNIESAWNVCKNHFRRIFGCPAAKFQGHLVEIMWRWWKKETNIYTAFFHQLRKIYTLEKEGEFQWTYPYFDNELCFNPPKDDIVQIDIPRTSCADDDLSEPEEDPQIDGSSEDYNSDDNLSFNSEEEIYSDSEENLEALDTTDPTQGSFELGAEDILTTPPPVLPQAVSPSSLTPSPVLPSAPVLCQAQSPVVSTSKLGRSLFSSSESSSNIIPCGQVKLKAGAAPTLKKKFYRNRKGITCPKNFVPLENVDISSGDDFVDDGKKTRKGLYKKIKKTKLECRFSFYKCKRVKTQKKQKHNIYLTFQP